MSRLASVTRLLRNDGRRLARDRFLLGSAAYLAGVSLAMRWLLPWLSRALERRRAFDLEPYYGLVVSYFVLFLAAVLVGMIGGFLLLGSREDRSIRALLVCPVPIRDYLAGDCIAMVIATTIIAIAESALIGVGRPGWPATILIVLTGALGAPICALYLATFADNEVDAFAQLKIVGASGLILLGVYFLDPPWQYLACLFPPYWFVKAWWIAEAGGDGWALWLLGGVVVSVGILVLLLDRFETVARRRG